MENDFDNKSHPTHQILDPVELELTIALVPLQLLDFLCIYPLAYTQDSFSKTEMNQSIMVQSCFELTQNLSQALSFHLEFENQSR